MKNKSQSSVYLAIFFFIVYIFCTQWSVSAAFEGYTGLSSYFTVAANCAWAVSLLMVLYRFITNLEYYTRNRALLVTSITAGILLALVAKSPAVFLPFFIGFVSIGVTNRSIAKLIVVNLVGFLILSAIFSQLGLNGGDVASKPPFGLESSASTTATALGLSNPNAVMTMFVNVIILGLFLCRSRALYTSVAILLLIITVVLGYATGSSTGLLISVLAILLMFSYKFIVSNSVIDAKNILRRITPYMFIVISTLSLVVAMNYNPSNPGVLNDLLTNRPYFWNLRIENDSYLNFYGNNDAYEVNPASREDNQVNHYPLDNGPIYTLVHYGILMYVLFLIVYYRGSKKLTDPELLVYVFMACIASFSGRITFLGFVYIFLVKAIVEDRLIRSNIKGSLK